jgi:hypothetical protein
MNADNRACKRRAPLPLRDRFRALQNPATAVALTLLCFFIAAPARAAENTGGIPRVEKLDDTSMKKLRQLVEPTAQHQMLSSLAGTWNYTAAFKPSEDADPQTSAGAMTNEMVVGGRFLSSKTSLILNVGEQNIPYEGWGLLGYDSANGVFTSVWADTLHSNVIEGAGKYNEKQKTIEEKGRFTLPLSGKEQAYRAELQWEGDDAYRRTIYITGASGREFKLVDIEFKRRK